MVHAGPAHGRERRSKEGRLTHTTANHRRPAPRSRAKTVAATPALLVSLVLSATAAMAQPTALPTALPKLAPNAAAKAPTTAAADKAISPELRDVFFGMPVHVRVEHPNAALIERTWPKLRAELRRLEAKMGMDAKGSELAGVNAVAGKEEVIVSAETRLLVQRGLEMCRRTGGAVDMTVLGYSYLWDLDRRPFVRPLPDELKARSQFTGCGMVALKDERVVRLMKPGSRLTLGEMVVGHALQMLSAHLREAGINNHSIRIGQHLNVQGRRNRTQHWESLIEAPAQWPGPRDQPLMRVYLSSHIAATRSVYERGIIHRGERYHDIIDPRTGKLRPGKGAADATLLATAIGTDPVEVDALSYALLVLPPSAALRLLDKTDNVEGFVVDGKGQVRGSRGMGDFAPKLPDVLSLEPAKAAAGANAAGGARTTAGGR